MTIALPPSAPSSADTEHTFSRGGREMPLQVLEIGGGPDHGHILVFGRPAENCLVRIHSRCLYGESLGSDDCDCGPELDKSLDLIRDDGAGVLVYLEQEGRGVGLLAKARGYRHSEQSGTDTFTSYEALGYPADARTYTTAAEGLHTLLVGRGIGRIQLLTNNPAKAAAVTATGLGVTVVPLRITALSKRASAYLDAKRRHRRHWIPTDDAPWAPDPS